MASLIVPSDMQCSSEDGGARKIDEPTNLGLVHPNGTNLRSTDLAPGAITPMVAGLSIEIELFADPQALQHRTSSLDYNILGMYISQASKPCLFLSLYQYKESSS